VPVPDGQGHGSSLIVIGMLHCEVLVVSWNHDVFAATLSAGKSQYTFAFNERLWSYDEHFQGTALPDTWSSCRM
jgi:hypothetical protein